MPPLLASLCLLLAADSNEGGLPARELEHVRTVVAYLEDDANEAERQYDSSRFLLSVIEDHGAEALPEDLRARLADFAARKLRALADQADDPARLRAGIALRLAPHVADDEVRDAVLEALLLWPDRVPWPGDLFRAVRSLRLGEALPDLEAEADRLASLGPEALARARPRWPIGELLLTVAALGGEEETDRIAVFLGEEVPDPIRGHAIRALGALRGERSLERLVEEARRLAGRDDAPLWMPLLLGATLVRRDHPEGVRLLLRRLERGPDLEARAWIDIAAARRFPDDAARLDYARKLGDTPPSRLRLRRWEENGFRVDALERAEHRLELLRVIEEGRPLPERIAAWLDLCRALGRDPFDGRFLRLRERTPGRAVIEHDIRPGDPLDEGRLEALREHHRRLAARLRGRLAGDGAPGGK